MSRVSASDWDTKVEAFVKWSPDSSETDILRQDIEIRGVNRDEKNVEVAQKHPNTRHFLTCVIQSG